MTGNQEITGRGIRQKRRIEISRHVIFNENEPFSTNKEENTATVQHPEQNEVENDHNNMNENEEENERHNEANNEENRDEIIHGGTEQGDRRSFKSKTHPDYYYFGALGYCSIVEPINYDQAMKNEEKQQWERAMCSTRVGDRTQLF